jgi:hypothetical protein
VSRHRGLSRVFTLIQSRDGPDRGVRTRGLDIKAGTMFSSATANLLTAAAPAVTTLSPHEIHLNYKAMKELPVHDSTNAN